MEERNVNTWEEFEKELKDLREERDKSNEFLKSPLLYRGQENSSWLLALREFCLNETIGGKP
jgi:hypothetical protein